LFQIDRKPGRPQRSWAPEPRSYLAEAVGQGLKTFDDDAVGHPLMLEERLKATAK